MSRETRLLELLRTIATDRTASPNVRRLALEGIQGPSSIESARLAQREAENARIKTVTGTIAIRADVLRDAMTGLESAFWLHDGILTPQEQMAMEKIRAELLKAAR